MISAAYILKKIYHGSKHYCLLYRPQNTIHKEKKEKMTVVGNSVEKSKIQIHYMH